MTVQTPNRILELWPMLSPEKRAAVLEMVETIAAPVAALRLTAEERAALDRSRGDYKAGRVLDEAEYAARMDAFMARLKAKSQVDP